MRKHALSVFLCLFCLSLLAACGTSNTAQKSTGTMTTPTPNMGAQILAASAQKYNAAQTLHGLFAVTVTGPDANGTVNSEVWSAKPALSRTVIQQSTIPNVTESLNTMPLFIKALADVVKETMQQPVTA